MLTTSPQVNITLTRDSVAMGDDCFAPHEKKIKINIVSDPDIFVRKVSDGYLVHVGGINHHWLCVLNGVEIARIEHSGISALVGEISLSQENRVHFFYHAASS